MTMYLWLTHEQAKTIIDHAKKTYPQEACGLIGGKSGQALTVVPIENIASQPQVQYQLDHAQQVHAMLGFQKHGYEITAIYHSHPKTPPIPSKTDIEQASYPDSVYLIVSLKPPEPTIAAWHIFGGRVEHVPLHIGANPPNIDKNNTLNISQKSALIISAILGFLFVLTYSIYLLPPAPPIPIPGG